MENNLSKDPPSPKATEGQGKREEILKNVKEGIINLRESPLYKFRIQNKVFPVIGEGSHEAKVMFVGEAPGRNEAATGRPFCGAAGHILTELIESIGLERKDVYITNIVKDRPPDNRDPLPEEIDLYAPFLDRQIDTIQPEAIATLGRYSMAYVMQKFGLVNELKNISQIHGKIFESTASYGIIKIIPLYHPAVALYQNSLKEQMFEDFKVLKKLL